MLTIHAPNDVPAPPSPPDADGDGIADVFDLDTDGDGSTDEEEFSNGTDPNMPNPLLWISNSYWKRF